MPKTPQSWTVRPIRIDGEWSRGPATITDGQDVVFVADDRIEIYDWAVASQLPYDLAAIRHPVDIVGFVRKWGFLTDEGGESATIDEFESEALHVGYLLYLYGLIAQRRDPARDRALAEYWLGFYEGIDRATREWLWKPDDRPIQAADLDRFLRRANLDSMAIDVREVLYEEVSNYLPAVEMTVRSLDFADWVAGEPKPPGHFLLATVPGDLLSRCYLEIALEMTAGVRVAECPEDGRIFAIRDPRQVYCSEQCAGRARYRRFVNRRRPGLLGE